MFSLNQNLIQISLNESLYIFLIILLIICWLFDNMLIIYLYYNRDLPGMPKYRTSLSLIISGISITIFGRLIILLFKNDIGCNIYIFLHSFGLMFSFSPYFISNLLLFLEIYNRKKNNSIIYKSQNQILIILCTLLCTIITVYLILRLYFAQVKYSYSISYRENGNDYEYKWCYTNISPILFHYLDNLAPLPLYIAGIILDQINNHITFTSTLSNVLSALLLIGFYIIEIIPFHFNTPINTLYCLYDILGPFLLCSSVVLLIYPRINKMKSINYRNLISENT